MQQISLDRKVSVQPVLQETILFFEVAMPNLNRIQEKILKEDIDSFFFTGKADIYYMTYFSSTNAFVLLTGADKFFITDGRYFEAAREKLKDWNVILLGESNKNHIDHLKEIIRELGGKKVGFQEDKVTVSFFKKLTEDKDQIFIGYEGFLNDIRMIKDEEEISIIKESVKKTDLIFSEIVHRIKYFKTELDVRRGIIDLIFQMRGTGESFPAIVASGNHSAIPHYETSDFEIRWNAPLLIDMGMKYKGYCSDFTRTLFLGKVDSEIQKVYEIVKEAHIAAVDKVKAGVPVKEIDLAARDVIEKYGYGEYFVHSTGHGVGIEIHEAPRISKNSDEILQENTVFTVEPGIYLPGKGGVRLENIVVCRKDGAEVLTTTPLESVLVE
ncbi:M24 family metallopeptidase [Persephonella sp.]